MLHVWVKRVAALLGLLGLGCTRMGDSISIKLTGVCRRHCPGLRPSPASHGLHQPQRCRRTTGMQPESRKLAQLRRSTCHPTNLMVALLPVMRCGRPAFRSFLKHQWSDRNLHVATINVLQIIAWACITHCMMTRGVCNLHPRVRHRYCYKCTMRATKHICIIQACCCMSVHAS